MNRFLIMAKFCILLVSVSSCVSPALDPRVPETRTRPDGVSVTCLRPPADVLLTQEAFSTDLAVAKIGTILNATADKHIATQRVRQEVQQFVANWEVVDYRACVNYASGLWDHQDYLKYSQWLLVNKEPETVSVPPNNTTTVSSEMRDSASTPPQTASSDTSKAIKSPIEAPKSKSRVDSSISDSPAAVGGASTPPQTASSDKTPTQVERSTAKHGWVYLGQYYDNQWKVKYFDLPAHLEPGELAKQTFKVRQNIVGVNVHTEMAGSAGQIMKPIATLRPASEVTIEEVKPWGNTSLIWAKVTY